MTAKHRKPIQVNAGGICQDALAAEKMASVQQ